MRKRKRDVAPDEVPPPPAPWWEDVRHACPDCKTVEFMEPSAFGHQRLMLCWNPICHYRRLAAAALARAVEIEAAERLTLELKKKATYAASHPVEPDRPWSGFRSDHELPGRAVPGEPTPDRHPDLGVELQPL